MAAGDGYVSFLLIRCVGEAGRAKAFMDGWFLVARGWISMYVRTYLSRYMYVHSTVPDAGTGSAFGGDQSGSCIYLLCQKYQSQKHQRGGASRTSITSTPCHVLSHVSEVVLSQCLAIGGWRRHPKPSSIPAQLV